jgi:hypothetical protein
MFHNIGVIRYTINEDREEENSLYQYLTRMPIFDTLILIQVLIQTATHVSCYSWGNQEQVSKTLDSKTTLQLFFVPGMLSLTGVGMVLRIATAAICKG